MRKTKEVLRLKFGLGLSHRDVGRSLGVSAGTVSLAVRRAERAGVGWEEAATMSEEALEARLYAAAEVTSTRPLPDFAWLHAERRRAGVTLLLLHQEYVEREPAAYGYSQFCEFYRRWLGKRGLSMRQVHVAGEKLFVDYSGKRPHFIDPDTGERVDVELFVAVLGASNYTFAEATRSQQGPDWIASHVRAFAFFGGIPRAVVPDQLKSGVTTACRYEPGIQRTYAELAMHYGTSILPARPAHPKDKAKVEGGVLIVQRWILARLRNERHFSLASLNVRIAELLEDLNHRRMRVYGCSRRELFDRLERTTLNPLPSERFTYGEWKRARVGIDYHVELDHHYYSVPSQFAREEVQVRHSLTTIEVYRKGQRVASHLRSHARGCHTTDPAHMPKAHQKHLEWTPARIVSWARTVGPQTAALVEAILTERRHPEQGYRSCLGVLRLGKRHGNERLEKACARALVAGARSYRNVDNILTNRLEQLPLPTAPATEAAPVTHENIRGQTYYN